MNSNRLIFTLALSFTFVLGMANVEDNSDKTKALDYLADTESYHLSMLADVDEKAWNHRIAEGKWTIAETAEHVLTSEKNIFATIQKTLANEKPDANKKSEIPSFEILKMQLHDRYSKRVKTVAPLEPKGAWISKKDYIKAYQKHRAEMIDFLKQNDQNLDHFFAATPVGVMTLTQYVVLAGAHASRHTLQIEEIKSALGLKTISVVFGGRVKVNIAADQREKVQAFFGEVLGLSIDKKERYDRILFDGGGFMAMVYHTDESQLLSNKDFAKAMQVGLQVPASQYQSIRFRMMAYGIKEYQPPYEVDTNKNFYFHAPGGQIFRVIKQQDILK